jgi:hypothetical protein
MESRRFDIDGRACDDLRSFEVAGSVFVDDVCCESLWC